MRLRPRYRVGEDGERLIALPDRLGNASLVDFLLNLTQIELRFLRLRSAHQVRSSLPRLASSRQRRTRYLQELFR